MIKMAKKRRKPVPRRPYLPEHGERFHMSLNRWFGNKKYKGMGYYYDLSKKSDKKQLERDINMFKSDKDRGVRYRTTNTVKGTRLWYYDPDEEDDDF